MSSSPTDQDVRRPVASTRGNQSTGSRDSRLSPVQVLAGALAAVSAAVIASLFGVAGTVVGAAVASVVSTVGAAIYSDSLRRTHAGLRRAHGRVLRRGQPGSRSAGAGGLPPLPARLDPRRSPARRWRRRSILAVTAVGVFLFALGVVTVVELIGREPMSALVGGSGHAGETTIGTLAEGIGGGQPGPAPAFPGVGVSGSSTAGRPPAAGSSPTGTASRGSAAADGGVSTVAASPTSASDAVPSTASRPASSAGNGSASTRPPAPTQAAEASRTAAPPPAAATTPAAPTAPGQAPSGAASGP
jgi:hypothetical protein